MSAQLFFLLQRYAQQGELAQGDLFSRGGVVSDYLFAKDRLFASLNLSDDEMALYDRIYQMLKPRTVTPDLVVYLQARTDVLLERIRKRGRRRGEARSAPSTSRRSRARTPSSSSPTTKGPLLIVNASDIDFVGDAEHRARAARRHQEARAGHQPLEPRVGSSREGHRSAVLFGLARASIWPDRRLKIRV